MHQLEILFTCEDPMEEFYPSSIIQSNRYFCRGRHNDLSEGFLIRSRLTLLLFVRVACCGPCVLLPHQACSRANGPLVSGPPPGPRACQGIEHTSHLAPGPLVMVHISRNGGPESGLLILGDFGDSWGLRACQGTGHTSVRAIGATSGAWGS